METFSGQHTLDMITIESYYCLSRASLGQIIKTLLNILNNIPKNTYEKNLYSRLKPAIEYLVGYYTDILKYSNNIEKDVKYYNLIVNLPKSISVNEIEHGNIKLKYAPIGKLIVAAKQRLEFIETREIPKLYIDNELYLKEFIKMKKQLVNFTYALKDFEYEFVDAVIKARNVIITEIC